jgi:hypothetical protein
MYVSSASSKYVFLDSLCDLTVRVPGYRYRGPVLDSRHYQFFYK